MALLLDTGILLRLANAQDERHGVVQQAIETLVRRHEELYTTVQNVAEFWNVATRPSANNGLGLAVPIVIELLEQIVEPLCALLIEHDDLYAELKRLGLKYAFIGKQVHDARLVAMMRCWGIDRIVTLNDRDLRRYEPEGIVVLTPQAILESDK